MADTVYTEPLTAELVAQIIEKENIDAILPTMGGQTGLNIATELGKLGLLEGIKVIGSDVQTIADVEDRDLFANFMDRLNEPIPKCHAVESVEEALEAVEEIGYPVIVKPYNLGSSVGIGKARNRQALEEALEEAFRYAEYALCERAIEKLREINCSVLGDADETRASVCEEPLNATDFLTYADKYQSGGGSKGSKGAKTGGESAGMSSLARKVPADLDEETAVKIRQMCVDAFRAINAAGVCRVDCMMDGDSGEIFVNEINTIPGSLSFYLWQPVGVPYKELLDRMIKLALKRARNEADIVYSFDTNVLNNCSFGNPKAGKLSK
jgi:D-alanine-D-alanine ligase